MNQLRIEYLKDNNIEQFGKELENFYETLTCNCYFRNQPSGYFEELLVFIEKYDENENDFWFNLSKGFILLRCKIEDIAFQYLTRAISLEPKKAIAYSIRSEIETPLNSNKINDAIEAATLNPTSRNYFKLAPVQNDIEFEILNYQKAIEINSKFACAHNNLGNAYQKIKNFKSAIEEYKRCLKINPNHWCYYSLWNCLDEEKDYQEALKYAELGKLEFPGKISYKFAIGLANARLENYEESVKYYQEYLNINPECEITKKHLLSVKSKLNSKYLEKANSNFQESNYEAYVIFFEKYLELNNNLSNVNLDKYLLSKLKSNKREIKISEENPIYQRLYKLRESFEAKQSNMSPSADEKNVSKLMIYGRNHKINFGIHKGKTLIEIITEDPIYINRCVINLIHFSISNFLILNTNLIKTPNYLLALEHNLIKKLVIENREKESIEDYEDIEFEEYDETYSQSRSYEKFGGYNGYSDDIIDDAFEGDPLLTWNVD